MNFVFQIEKINQHTVTANSKPTHSNSKPKSSACLRSKGAKLIQQEMCLHHRKSVQKENPSQLGCLDLECKLWYGPGPAHFWSRRVQEAKQQ